MTGVWNDRAHCTRSRAVSVSEFQLVFLLRGGYRNWKGDAFRRFSIYSNIYHVPPFHWIPIWCTRCHPGARCLHLFKLAVACCTLNFSLHRVRVFPPARNSYFMLQPRCFIGRGGGGWNVCMRRSFSCTGLLSEIREGWAYRIFCGESHCVELVIRPFRYFQTLLGILF